MATKKAASKPVTRKTQAKKANAPMKNAPAEKPPANKVKAAASKAARTMAKTVKPSIRKSAAKRVEKDEKAEARMALARQLHQEGFAAVKKQANRLIAILRNDMALIAAGKGDEEEFRELVIAASRAIIKTKKKQGWEFE